MYVHTYVCMYVHTYVGKYTSNNGTTARACANIRMYVRSTTYIYACQKKMIIIYTGNNLVPSKVL